MSHRANNDVAPAGSRPVWASRLYKKAPLQFVMSIPHAQHGSNLIVELLCVLACGHDRIARLRSYVMLPDAHGVPRERHVRLMRPDELAQHVPRLRCRDCIEAAYPELRRLGHSGRYDERDCSSTDLARIAAHENGEQVQPVAPWVDGSVVSR